MKSAKYLVGLFLTGVLLCGMVSPAHAVSQLWFLDRAALIQRLIELGYITPPPKPEIDMMSYVGGFQGGEVVVDVKAKDGENAVHFTRPHPRDLPEGAEFIAYRDENNVLNGRIIWKSEEAAIGKMTIPVAVSDGNQSVTEDVVIRIHEAVEDEEPSVYIQNVDYSATGQIDLIEYGNGVTTDYEYSPLTLRLERIHTFNNYGDVLQDLHYTYDPVGNIVAIEDRVHSANQAFAYDEQSRLVRAEGESYGIKTYAYDAIGNIIEKDGLTYTYGENGAGVHAVTSLSDGTTFAYDANGNMLTEREPDGSLTEFDYDAENRLTAVTKNGFKTATYTYDGDGGRTSKTVNGVMTKYIGSLYEETGERQTQHIFLGSTRIASVTDGEAVYHHTDHLGGANVISDENGITQELIEYTPFGDFARHEKYGDGEEIAWHYFTGQHYDKETELYFYNARYYNQKLGRFISADSIVQSLSNPQTFNRYAYTSNNPVNRVDPSGHSWKKFWRKFGDFVSPLGRAVVTGDWENFGYQMLNIIGFVMAPGFWLKASAALSYTSRATSHIEENWSNEVSRGTGIAGAAIGIAYAAWNVGVGVKNWLTHPEVQYYDVAASQSAGFGVTTTPQSGDKVFINGVGTKLSDAMQQAARKQAEVLAYNPSHGVVADFVESTLQKVTFTSSFSRQVSNSFVGLSGIQLVGYSQGSIVASNVALNVGLRGHRSVFSNIEFMASAVSQPRVYLSSATAGLNAQTITYSNKALDFINIIGPNLNPFEFVGGAVGAATTTGFKVHSAYFN